MSILTIVLLLFTVGTAITMVVAVMRRTMPRLAQSGMAASVFGLLIAGRLAETGDRHSLAIIVGATIIFVGLAFQSWEASTPKNGDA